MKNLLLILLICSFSYCSFGQIQESKAIDSIFLEWNKPDVPGCALGIINDGKLIYSNGYGIADLEHDVEITPTSVFGVGSITKHFVSFSILLLEEQGKLSIDDNIQKYLPDFPEYEADITIRHLLYHTDGIRDYGSLKYFKGINGLNYIDSDYVYDLLKRQKELNCFPGEEFIYGNSGQFLLGRIVEKASGKSLRLFAQEHIFGPLGMKNTLFYDNNKDLIKNRAFSYSTKTGEKGYNNIINRNAGGGLRTTIEDLVKWDQNFYNNKLGKGEQLIIQKMHEEGLLNNGESTGRPLGLQIRKYKGLKVVGSAGSGFGYKAQLMRFPDENFSVIILANREDANPTKMAYQVADILLENKFVSDSNKEEAKKEFSLNQLVGDYEVVPNRAVEITLKNDMLHVLQKWDGAAYPVVNTIGNTYEIPNYSAMQLVFSDLENSFTQNLTVFLEGSKFIFARKEKIEFSTPILDDYTGDFYSHELDASFLIYKDGEDLFVKIVNDDPMKLSLYDYHNDAFYFSDDLLRFTRSNGVITGFELDAGRVNNLKFEKKMTDANK
ncbi:MAG: beta-lactamase family protein [Bacteroidetes bacterium]|jgi:CubicO group peptidase (beta-lactamase class C family)|nr:beta-lactamase family protein [Bacteroidota bacterium]